MEVQVIIPMKLWRSGWCCWAQHTYCQYFHTLPPIHISTYKHTHSLQTHTCTDTFYTHSDSFSSHPSAFPLPYSSTHLHTTQLYTHPHILSDNLFSHTYTLSDTLHTHTRSNRCLLHIHTPFDTPCISKTHPHMLLGYPQLTRIHSCLSLIAHPLHTNILINILYFPLTSHHINTHKHTLCLLDLGKGTKGWASF